MHPTKRERQSESEREREPVSAPLSLPQGGNSGYLSSSFSSLNNYTYILNDVGIKVQIQKEAEQEREQDDYIYPVISINFQSYLFYFHKLMKAYCRRLNAHESS